MLNKNLLQYTKGTTIRHEGSVNGIHFSKSHRSKIFLSYFFDFTTLCLCNVQKFACPESQRLRVQVILACLQTAVFNVILIHQVIYLDTECSIIQYAIPDTLFKYIGAILF